MNDYRILIQAQLKEHVQACFSVPKSAINKALFQTYTSLQPTKYYYEEKSRKLKIPNKFLILYLGMTNKNSYKSLSTD